jgi:alpha-mannosidase
VFYIRRTGLVNKHESGKLLPEKSWLTVSDERIIASAFKKCIHDEAIIARMYNISDETVEFILVPGIAAREVFLSYMLEENGKPLCISDNKIIFKAREKEIITFI